MQSLPGPPLVSVVIPYFNRNATLPATLQSVAAQSYPSLEILIVDDASEVDPSEIIRSLSLRCPVSVFRQPVNRGPSAARNIGIERANGRFIGFLDSDDRWLSNKIERQVEALLSLSNPDSGIAIAETWELGPKGERRRRRWSPREQSLSDFFFVSSGTMQTSSILVATELARQVRFDDELRQYEDFLFLLKANFTGAQFVFQDEKLFHWYRLNAADRLSGKINLTAGNRFLALAEKYLTEDARICFNLRMLGPAVLRNDPAAFMSLSASALRRGIITPRGILGVMRRSMYIKIF